MLSSIVHLNLMMSTIHHTTPDPSFVWYLLRDESTVGISPSSLIMSDDERNVILVLMVYFHTMT